MARLVWRSNALAAACAAVTLFPTGSLPTGRVAVEPRIVTSANVRVSQDADIPHSETTIAASPVDPSVLIAASIVHLTNDAHTRAYVSRDRGSTWRGIVLPDREGRFGSDPVVGVGRSGTLYFATLGGGLSIYRSVDTGRTWSNPVKVTTAVDRPNLAVDLGSPRFAGRVYLAGEGEREVAGALEDGIYVFSSDDDGATWNQGTKACVRRGWQMWNTTLATFSDGTLFVGCYPYSNDSARRRRGMAESGFVTSSDGGRTFSPYRAIVVAPSMASMLGRRLAKRKFLVSANSSISCAVNLYGNLYRDRIYCVWEQYDIAAITSRIHLTYSADRGQTWSPPRAVDRSGPSWVAQFQPSIAVNREGIVGVAWLDTRASVTGDRYELRFSASPDGGSSFLPAARISSAPSFPMVAGNLRLSGAVERDQLVVASAFAWHPTGGEYAGMAADTLGEFHPIWPDARSGASQLYSAAIRVTDGREPILASVPRTRERLALGDKATLIFEGSTVDTDSLVGSIRVRVRNASADTLYGPFGVEIVGFPERTQWKGLHPDLVRFYATPTFLNASNGKPGIGARFDYVRMAGTLDLLPPGGVTEAMEWRFRVQHPYWTRVIAQTRVIGFVRNPRESPMGM